MRLSLDVQDYREPAIVGTTISFNCSQPEEVLIGPDTVTCMDDGQWEPDPHQIQISCKGDQSINFDSLIVSIYPIYGIKSKSFSLIVNREINAYFNNRSIINNRVIIFPPNSIEM